MSNDTSGKNNKLSPKAVRDGAMMTAITVIFMLVSLYVPIFSVAAMFLSGLPLAVLCIKDGLKPTVWSAAVSVLIVFAFTGNILSAMSLMITNGLPGIAAGACIKKKLNLFYSVICTGTAFLIGLMSELLMIKLFMGGIEQMFVQIFEMTEKAMEEAGSIMSAAGGAAPDKNTVSSMLDMIKSVFRLYFPSMLIIMSMVSGYIVYVCYAWFLRRLKLTKIVPTPFKMLRMPRGMGFAAIILYLLSMLLRDENIVGAVLLNATAVLYAIMGICGFSFVDFKLSMRIPKGTVRAVIYAALLLLGGMLMPLAINLFMIIGLLDSSNNFRKISSFFGDDYSDDRSGEV